MILEGERVRPLMLNADGWSIRVIDQRRLPWEIIWAPIEDMETAYAAIRDMWVRGAPLLGATGAYGLCLALRADPSDAGLAYAYGRLVQARPTAINLKWCLDQIKAATADLPPALRAAAAYARAAAICDEDAAICAAIGRHGLTLIKEIAARRAGGRVQILTHCNAGALATLDHGTATAPLYAAHESGVPIHVWVDETRPRNQGAALTAFELRQHGVPHTVIADNAGGLLMQRGQIDLCIVGVDRVTRNGDVLNKIGTYLKALAAKDCGTPFYAATPYPSIDLGTASGDLVEIEERAPHEVTHVDGLDEAGRPARVRITTSDAANPAFDMTPARLITGYITERGVLNAADLGA